MTIISCQSIKEEVPGTAGAVSMLKSISLITKLTVKHLKMIIVNINE